MTRGRSRHCTHSSMFGSNYLSQCGYTVHSNLAACAGKSLLPMSGHGLVVEIGDHTYMHLCRIEDVYTWVTIFLQIVATFEWNRRPCSNIVASVLHQGCLTWLKYHDPFCVPLIQLVQQCGNLSRVIFPSPVHFCCFFLQIYSKADMWLCTQIGKNFIWITHSYRLNLLFNSQVCMGLAQACPSLAQWIGHMNSLIHTFFSLLADEAMMNRVCSHSYSMGNSKSNEWVVEMMLAQVLQICMYFS